MATRLNDGTAIRPWTGVLSARPACDLCVWVWDFPAHAFHLKFINRICPRHRGTS